MGNITEEEAHDQLVQLVQFEQFGIVPSE